MAFVTVKPAAKPLFFDNSFNQLFKQLDTMLPKVSQGNQFFQAIPAVNVKEDEKGFQIEVAAPGLQKEDFKVSLHENRLSISASKEQNQEVKTEKYTRQEFNYSNFQRSFALPKNIDGDSIQASYENGILSIVLPKKEEIKPAVKAIAIA